MKSKYTFILFIGGILIVSLCVIYYNSYRLKINIEGFLDYDYNTKVGEIYNTTLENYKQGYDYNAITTDSTYYNYIHLTDVKDNYPMFTYGCVKQNASDITNLNLYMSSYEFYTLSINDIYQKIVEDLHQTLSKTQEQTLNGPIYVIIYQTPSLSYNNEAYIARYDVINNLKASYDQQQNDVLIGSKQLYTRLLIMYPMYMADNSRVVKNTANGVQEFKTYFDAKLSKHKLCFIECNGDNTYACGCLNTDNSKCIELDNRYYNYGMIYVLNKFNRLFTKYITNESKSVI